MRIPFTASSLLLAGALLAPFAAQAQDTHCKHSEPRQLALDVAGVKAVVFDIGPNELKLDAAPGAAAGVQGRACASRADALPGLKLTQERSGDKLLVRAFREGQFSGIFLGDTYAYQNLTATLPDTVTVQLKVGSGEAAVSGAPILSVDVGSGEVVARNIRGLVAASVGSGDVELHDIGQLNVISVGSGDLKAHGVRGAAKVGSVGSGDFEGTSIDGSVEIGSIGSGDATLHAVKGDVSVGSVGSGDFEARDVGGALRARSVGSGSVRHDGVRGTVDIPTR